MIKKSWRKKKQLHVRPFIGHFSSMFAITYGIAFDLRYRVLVRRRSRQSRHYKLRRSIHRVNLSAFQLAGERVRRWRRINWTMLLTREPLCSWLSKFTICVFLRVYEYGFVCMGVLAPILAGGVAIAVSWLFSPTGGRNSSLPISWIASKIHSGGVSMPRKRSIAPRYRMREKYFSRY